MTGKWSIIKLYITNQTLLWSNVSHISIEYLLCDWKFKLVNFWQHCGIWSICYIKECLIFLNAFKYIDIDTPNWGLIKILFFTKSNCFFPSIQLSADWKYPCAQVHTLNNTSIKFQICSFRSMDDTHFSGQTKANLYAPLF